MEFTCGIINNKNTISNKSHFVKGCIVHHNIVFTIILYFNNNKKFGDFV